LHFVGNAIGVVSRLLQSHRGLRLFQGRPALGDRPRSTKCRCRQRWCSSD